MNLALLDLNQRLQLLPDPRRTTSGHYLHNLGSIVASTFCAISNGRTGYRAIADFIEDNIDALRLYVDFPNGSPSHDTIRRCMNNVDPKSLARIFRAWAGVDSIDPTYLQADGKTIRGSKSDDGKATHVLTLFASDYMASLMEVEVGEKANEITAFKTVVDNPEVDFEGKVITADAILCQTYFCRAITKAKGDFVFVLKGNHPSMFNDVQLFMTNLKEYDSRQIVKKGHGCLVVKDVRFTTDVEWLTKIYDFPGLKSLGQITTTVTEKGKTTTSVMYLISSLSSLDELFAAREKHWGIESMHWILDTSFDEDQCRARTDKAPLNLNIMRKTAIFLFNLASKSNLPEFKGKGVKRIRDKCSNAFRNLLKVFALIGSIASIFGGK